MKNKQTKKKNQEAVMAKVLHFCFKKKFDQMIGDKINFSLSLQLYFKYNMNNVNLTFWTSDLGNLSPNPHTFFAFQGELLLSQ